MYMYVHVCIHLHKGASSVVLCVFAYVCVRVCECLRVHVFCACVQRQDMGWLRFVGSLKL